MKVFLCCEGPFLKPLSILLFLYLLKLRFCWSLHDEGVGLLKFKDRVVSDPLRPLSENPSSWSGIERSQRYVVKLSLDNRSRQGKINAEASKRQRSRKLLQDPFENTPYFWFFPNPPPPPPPTSEQDSPPPLQSPFTTASQAPSPDHVISPPSKLPDSPSSETPVSPSFVPSPAEVPRALLGHSSRKSLHRLVIISSAIGGPLALLLLIAAFYFVKSGKIATVKPWRTGLSGQLQKAFVTGVPKLKRSELQAACEDFSNVIGSLPFCTLYKGTLSSGVEIAVASIAVSSAKDWSGDLEAQFRNKIDTLSKVNHKNFVSILGYCEEEEPFTRMMVFEYAPNGTLFEHLHIKESEHLDWATRMRIAMGVIYCLEHMHQLSPPSPHNDLNSSSVYLTEDYAAKISNFAFMDESSSSSSSEMELNLRNDVYSFGTLLFEMVTGKLLRSSGRVDHSLQDWLFDYLNGEKPLREMVDSTLETYREDQLQKIDVVIRSCCNEDWRERPSVREVCTRLKEITLMGPDEAVPKRSPLWWAELEILSTEAAA